MSFDEHMTRLEKGMTEFMPHGGYTEKDVESCMEIMRSYYNSLQLAKTKEEARSVIEKTTCSLNILNERCDYSLIETDQREDICVAIRKSSNKFGFNDSMEDLTEEWRDW